VMAGRKRRRWSEPPLPRRVSNMSAVEYKGAVYVTSAVVKVINPRFDPEYKHKPETKWGKRLFMVPPKGYKVTLNPNYDPKTDDTYYSTSISEDGKQKKLHYTKDFTNKSKEKKFGLVAQMDPKLESIRKKYKRDLLSKDPGLRAHALAALLFDYLLFRAGNSDSAKRGVRGLTTLQCRHVKVNGGSIDFNYTGKDSVKQHQFLRDCPKTAKRVAVMLQGKEPLDYFLSWTGDNGKVYRVTAASVNQYLSGIWKPLTTHKFRSYHASKEAEERLAGPVPKKYKVDEKKLLKYMKLKLKPVTRLLGHKSTTTTTKHYVDPPIMHEFFERHNMKLPTSVLIASVETGAGYRVEDDEKHYWAIVVKAEDAKESSRKLNQHFGKDHLGCLSAPWMASSLGFDVWTCSVYFEGTKEELEKLARHLLGKSFVKTFND